MTYVTPWGWVQDAADTRREVMRRLHRAMAMATAGELHRAAEFLEFAREVRRGKRKQRAGWRGRRDYAENA